MTYGFLPLYSQVWELFGPMIECVSQLAALRLPYDSEVADYGSPPSTRSSLNSCAPATKRCTLPIFIRHTVKIPKGPGQASRVLSSKR